MDQAYIDNINFNYYSLCSNRWYNATDIYEHLPTLYKYAKDCESVLETGLRSCISTWAFTKGLIDNNKFVKSLFLNNNVPCNIDELLKVTSKLPIKLEYKWMNNLELELPSMVDLSFINTWHVYGQLKRELAKFSKLTKKYIIMHNTSIDGIHGESIRLNHDIIKQSKETGFPIEEIKCGLQKAIDEFLDENKSWIVDKVYTNNNGLTILKRINDMSNPFKLLATRYSDRGINTISDVEVFKSHMNIKNYKRQIYHVRMDDNKITTPWDTLEFFTETVLPTINRPFVCLVTGEDITVPNQIDPRWQDQHYKSIMRKFYDSIVNHPLLLHFYIENRDEVHEKTSSLPLGLNPRDSPGDNIDFILDYVSSKPEPMMNRQLKAICIHRDRPGDREIVNKFRDSDWKENVITGTHYILWTWYDVLRSYPFIICAHGGGVDPCPKIWEALIIGCIPIIKHSAMDDVYKQFPVVFVDSWDKDTIQTANLEKWRDEYAKYFDDPELRKEWTRKLYLNYWAEKIKSHF